MSYKMLSFGKIGSIGLITINCPVVDNAINRRLCQELSGICSLVNQDEDVSILIVTGDGEKAFCVGLEKKESGESIFQRTLPLVAEPVASLAIPVIAAINGDALGQGLELALACDIRIAVESARFGLPQVASGLMPWDGGTQRLPRLVGRGKAMEMLLTGQTVDASEAYRIGLVSKVVRREELMSTTMDFAQSLASGAPAALRYAKEAALKGMDLTLEQGLRLEADLYFLLQTTEDRTEGIKAFLEKRSPKFRGA